jgi:hypothetical protein
MVVIEQVMFYGRPVRSSERKLDCKEWIVRNFRNITLDCVKDKVTAIAQCRREF